MCISALTNLIDVFNLLYVIRAFGGNEQSLTGGGPTTSNSGVIASNTSAFHYTSPGRVKIENCS